MSRKDGAANAIDFWDSVSSTFKDNELVFYELYNEPHDVDANAYIHGNNQYAGVLEMMQAVRKNAPDQVFVIAGGDGWAYDSDTLITLDS